MGKNDDAVDLDNENYLGVDPVYMNHAYDEHAPEQGVNDDEEGVNEVIERVKTLEAERGTPEGDEDAPAFDEWVKTESVERMKSEQVVGQRTGTRGVGDASAAGGAADDGEDTDDVPNRSDNKAEWVEYAVSQGVSREEAEAATKEELIALYG